MNPKILLERVEAGRQLAERLIDRGLQNPAILVIPPGGVRIGWKIAQRLGAPMDVISVLEVIVPGERGARIGAVADGLFMPAPNPNTEPGTQRDEGYVSRLVGFDIQRQMAQDTYYRREQPRLDLRNRNVVLVDDGWATPDMIVAAVAAIRRRGATAIMYATPQCQIETYARLGADVGLVSIYPRQPCRSVVLIDGTFTQLTPSETAELIRKSRLAGNPQVEPLMNPIPGASAAAQASNMALVHFGSYC